MTQERLHSDKVNPYDIDCMYSTGTLSKKTKK